jgi:SAM-dependent methyltransferase
VFDALQTINARPPLFGSYTASDLWTDEHTSKRMLEYHLDDRVAMASRSTAFIDRSVRWIVSHFGVDTHTTVVDMGCGPGLYTTRLARHGAAVTGIDFSRRSIHHAMETAAGQGLAIDYLCQDYLTFETDRRFDLALMIMCDLCALSPVQRRHLLGTLRRLLTDRGALLLDVYSLVAFARREETATYAYQLLDGFWSSERYYGFLNTFKYDDAKVVLDKYTVVEEERTRTVYNWLQYFSPDSLRTEFAEAGWKVESFHGDVAGAPYSDAGEEFAVVARGG